jgi:hypothetical protein
MLMLLDWSVVLQKDELREYALQLEQKLERIESLCQETKSDKDANNGTRRFAHMILELIK